jgi:L-galactose dehydrogenase
METRPLGRTGLHVSKLALGGAAVGQQYGPVSVAEVADAFHFGIDAGINFVDTSAYYGEGRSEEILGEVLAGGWREKVVLCTKAGRLGKDRFDFSARGMRECFEASLRRLKVDHVDLLLAHDIEYADDLERVFDETATVLHALKAEGKCRFVGMSAFPLAVLRRAVESCRLDAVISYCHYTLQNQLLLSELLPIADRHGVGVLNASPLAMGLLTDAGPPPWHPAGEDIKTACRNAAAAVRARGADIATLALQYCVDENKIPSTITGTAKRAELAANLRAIDNAPDPELLAVARKELETVRDRTWPSGKTQFL